MEKDFDYSVSEFSKLVNGRNESDREHMNRLLDNLNAINYRDFVCVNSDRPVLLIHQCCTLVSPSDTFLVAKSCHLIMNLVGKLGVRIVGKSLSVVVNWCCQSLKSSADIAILDVLQALHAVISSQVTSIEEVSKDLVLKLSEKLEKRAMLLNPQEVKLWRVRCIHALALTSTLEPLQINDCMKIITELLSVNAGSDSFASAEVITSCIEAVQGICEGNPSWLNEHLGEVIGIAMVYLHYGLLGWKFSPPQRLYPIQTPVLPHSFEQKGTNARCKKRKKAIKQGSKLKDDEMKHIEDPQMSKVTNSSSMFFNNAHWPTSDSDFSDSEGGRIAKMKRSQANVRVAVLNLLLKISKLCGCKELFGYYSSLLGNAGLPFSIINESAMKVRGTSVATTTALISAGKPLFANAQSSDIASYVPFSGILADLLKSLHMCLIEVLKRNNPALITTSILHCAAALIDSTPYHRLHPGLLTPLLNVIHTYLQPRERNTTVAILTCFGAIISHDTFTDEFHRLIATTPPVSITDSVKNESTVECYDEYESWMIKLFIDLLQDTASPVQVCVEVWQVLCQIAKCHFRLLATKMCPLIKCLQCALLNTSDVLQFHAAKALEQIAVQMSNIKELEMLCTEMWISLLKNSLIKILQSTSMVAAVACDCIANIGCNIYSALPDDVQILIITVLFGCSQHEEATVRASAARAIGMFLLYPMLMEDEQFVFDVSESVMNLLKDPNACVRIKTAWTLGNLTDCLHQSKHPEVINSVPLDQLFQSTLTAVQSENVNVKVNAVRGLGNIIRLLKEEHLSQNKYKSLLEKSTNCLTRLAATGGNMKLRWNACYALSSLIENETVQRSSLSTWQEPVLNTLCSVLVKCNNFKVRANASAALSNITNRKVLGSHYTTAWQAVLEGLDNSFNMPDFSEFKHQDTLFNQLCVNLCNLAKLVEEEDLVSLHDILVYRMDTAREHIERFQRSALPEVTSPILAARNHIINKLTSENLNQTHLATLSMLSNIFLIDS